MSNLSAIAAQMTRDATRLGQLEKALQWIEAYGAKQRKPGDDLAVIIRINRGSACVGASEAATAYEEAIMTYWPEVAEFALGEIRAEIQSLKSKYAAVLP